MKQSDAVQFLFRDLKVVTTDLALDHYDQVFEEEMREYFPFNDTITDWLVRLYQSEKYASFDENKLSLYFEKEHPFLFMRDLAHMNSWNLGYQRKDRRDHITGLMFSETPSYALESTLCLCRPSLVKEPQSQWFDFKQAMTNLEFASTSSLDEQAWKACALFYLYFHLSGDGQSISREEVLELLEPYLETLAIAVLEGDQALRQEAGIITQFISSRTNETLMDGFRW